MPETTDTQTHAQLSAAPSRLEGILLPEESKEEFRAIRIGFHEELRPQGTLERVMVDRFLVLHWRMQRSAIMEAQLIAERQEVATAWSNPRRVKTRPSAGAVWGDDQQYHGGSLEKLSKQEYRWSLEAGRVLRDLAKKQKARLAEEMAENDNFDQSLNDNVMALYDTVENYHKPPNVPDSDSSGKWQNIEQKTKSENFQNEPLALDEAQNSRSNEPNPISRRADASRDSTKAARGGRHVARYDNDALGKEIERRINRHPGAAQPPRTALVTWPGSGG